MSARYHVVVRLPNSLSQRIAKIKKQWEGDNGSEPHLTILPPHHLKEGATEHDLIEVLSKSSNDMDWFIIWLNGVGYFGEKQSIHFCVHRNDKLLKCHRTLVSATKRMLIPVGTVYGELNHPHITIANHLTPETGGKAWDALQHLNFRDCIIAKSCVLYRKESSEKRAEPIKVISLQEPE